MICEPGLGIRQVMRGYENLLFTLHFTYGIISCRDILHTWRCLMTQEASSQQQACTRKTILIIEEDAAIGMFILEAIS